MTAGIDCRRLLLVKNQTWCRSHAGDRAPPGHYIRNQQPDRNSCTEHMHIRSSDNCLRKRRDGFQHAKRRCVSTIFNYTKRGWLVSYWKSRFLFTRAMLPSTVGARRPSILPHRHLPVGSRRSCTQTKGTREPLVSEFLHKLARVDWWKSWICHTIDVPVRRRLAS